MIEAARRGRDKNGVLPWSVIQSKCAMASQLGHSLHVVTSSSRGSSDQPISFLKLRRDMALSVAETLCATGERWYKLRLLYGCRVSRCVLAVRRLAGKQQDFGSIRFGFPFSSLQKL